MSAYLLGSSKGGAGKTTWACNLAALLASSGRRVALLDTDVQRHLSEWAVLRRSFVHLPALDLEQAVGLVAERVRALQARYDDVVIDAGGRDSVELRSAATAADILLIPSPLGQFDLYAVRDMASLVERARDFNPHLVAAAFVNKASTNWTTREQTEALRRGIGDLPGLVALETIAHLRTASFGKVGETGLGVFEMGKSGAQAAEVLFGVMQEVESLLRGAKKA